MKSETGNRLASDRCNAAITFPLSACPLCLPQTVGSEAEKLKEFFSRNTYISGRYAEEDSFAKLHTHIQTLPGGVDANRLFYMALPPTVYHDVSKNIKHHCMSTK